jgi:hypothetical protein
MGESWVWVWIWVILVIGAAFLLANNPLQKKRDDDAKRREQAAFNAAKDCGIEERSAILNQAVLEYVNLGWRVISQTPTTAQLARDKHANGCLAFILFFLLIVPCILYLLLYKGTESCYLEVNIKGRVIYHYAK